MKGRALVVILLLAPLLLGAREVRAPSVYVLPAGDGVAVVLGDTDRSVKGFLVYRSEGVGEFRLLTGEPVTAVSDPYRAAELMGSDFRWLAGKIGSADPVTVWRKLTIDRNRALAYCLVSHGLRAAMGRTFVDTTVRKGDSYTYRVVLLDAAMRGIETVERRITAGEPVPPSAPGAVGSEPGNGEVTVRWDYPAYGGGDDTVVGFHVYRSGGGSETERLTYAPILRADGYLEFYDESAVNGASYRYTVTAVDLIGIESRGTTGPTVAPADTEPPLVPQGITAVDTGEDILVLWNISPDLDVDHYRVFRSTRSNEGFERIDSGGIQYDDPRFSDSGIVRGITYYYKIVAVDDAGNESLPGGPAHVSPRDTEPPGVVSGLTAVVDTDSRSVELRWSPAMEPDLRGYFVYRGDSDESMIRLTPKPAVPGEGEAFSDDGYKGRGLLPGSSLVYAVSAVDLSYNEGPLSYTNVEIPDAVPPEPPFSLSARPTPEGAVRLSWMVRREEEIAGFIVYRTVEGRTETVYEADGGSTRWIDAATRRGIAHEYRVSAVDAAGNESAPSTPVTVTPTDVVPPDPPAGVKVEPAESGAVISWEPVTADDLAGYRVYRSRYRGARPEIVSDGIVGLTRFTDTGAKPGAVYAVSAVDTSLNEGPRSGAVTYEGAAP